MVIFDVHVYGFHVHDHLMKYVRSSSGNFICTFWVLYHEGLPGGLTLAWSRPLGVYCRFCGFILLWTNVSRPSTHISYTPGQYIVRVIEIPSYDGVTVSMDSMWLHTLARLQPNLSLSLWGIILWATLTPTPPVDEPMEANSCGCNFSYSWGCNRTSEGVHGGVVRSSILASEGVRVV